MELRIPKANLVKIFERVKISDSLSVHKTIA